MSIKIDPYNFQLYHFKVGAFFETQCSLSSTAWSNETRLLGCTILDHCVSLSEWQAWITLLAVGIVLHYRAESVLHVCGLESLLKEHTRKTLENTVMACSVSLCFKQYFIQHEMIA